MESSVLLFCLHVGDLVGYFDLVGEFVFFFSKYFDILLFRLSRS